VSHCLLTGGSSQIGHFLLPKLLATVSDVQVLALARQRRPQHLAAHERLHWLVAPAAELDQKQRQQIIEIISLGPLQLALDAIPRCPALQRVVAVTSSSILIKQHSADDREAREIRALAAAEQILIEACQRRSITCQVLRPTLIYGAGLDANVCALALLAERFGMIPVAGKAAGKRRPVHAFDLAAAILRLREIDQAGIWTVTGGSTLSYRQLAESVCQTLQRGRVVGVPSWLLHAVLAAAHLGGRLRTVNSAMIQRQRQDLLFDDQAAKTDWGWSPQPFQLLPQMLHAPQRPWQMSS